MQNFLYRTTFILVACGSLLSIFSFWLPSTITKFPFGIIYTFGFPLPSVIFSYLPHLPAIFFSFLRLIFFLLVIHRIYIIYQYKSFSPPQAFKKHWIVLAAIGLASFLLYMLAFGSLVGFYSMADPIFFYLHKYALSISHNILPLTFAVVELVSLKEKYEASS